MSLSKGAVAAMFAAVLAVTLFMPAGRSAESRFPPPDFETDYRQPPLDFQTRRRRAWEIVDTAALILALGGATFLLLYRRSRTGVFVLGLLAVAYFGFFKKGCICPVGSLQNAVLALADPGYAIPLAVIVVFLAPLLFAMAFGRIFCGSVCPLGAIQDVFLFLPLKVPRWLDEALGLVRWFVLGIVVYLVAATGEFHLCRLDPFVGLFRMGGPAWLLFTGAGILALGMFVGRPYCRYICPYGALLSVFSGLPAKGVSVTPDDCDICTLCEDTCPFGAILPPGPEYRAGGRMTAAAWIGGVALVPSLGAALYFASGRTAAGACLGVFLGLAVGLRLVSLTRAPERKEYEVDHSRCLSCGRCYKACPRERKRLGLTGGGTSDALRA